MKKVNLTKRLGKNSYASTLRDYAEDWSKELGLIIKPESNASLYCLEHFGLVDKVQVYRVIALLEHYVPSDEINLYPTKYISAKKVNEIIDMLHDKGIRVHPEGGTTASKERISNLEATLLKEDNNKLMPLGWLDKARLKPFKT